MSPWFLAAQAAMVLRGRWSTLDPRVAELGPAARAAALRERRDALAAHFDGAVRAALVA